MSIEKFIDGKIANAIEQGEFDDLPGKGKPLDLGWYFNLPEELRLTYSVLKNANCLPEEADLLKQVESLKAELQAIRNDTGEAQSALRKQIQEKLLAINLLLENRRSRR
jgi:hypothetical protein